MVIGMAIVAAMGGFVAGWLVGRTGLGSTIDPSSLSDRERGFVERMRDAALVGSFTTDGGENSEPSADRYEIDSVEKVGDDLWRFNARMNCCGINGAIPVVVPLRWVGDTPMIMMTDTSLPGVGTFTVRLFFYEERYAGTWQHGERGGGLMFGRIEKRLPSGR